MGSVIRKIVGNGPLALATSKRILTESADWSEYEGWDRQAALVEAIEGSADAREGALAFVEKRTPVWTGR